MYTYILYIHIHVEENTFYYKRTHSMYAYILYIHIHVEEGPCRLDPLSIQKNDHTHCHIITLAVTSSHSL